MKTQEKMLAISAESAQSGDSKEAEKVAADSRLTPGEEGLAAEDKRNKEDEFRALIEGEYKDQFNKTVQKIITKRLREVKTMKETAQKNTQLIETLMKKMGIEDNDSEKLERMIDDMMTQDNSKAWEKTAAIIKKLLAENSYLKEERTKQMQDSKINSLVSQWNTQAEETKKAYSDFDIKKELNNPEFCRLLRLGVGMKTAYEVLNIDAILDKNSKNAEKMVVDSIRFKGNRPVENGSEAGGGIILSSNVSRLNKKQRAELAKRAAKGERISF